MRKMGKRRFQFYHNINCWLIALWELWNHCRKGSASREFYYAWWEET